ncbi:DUF4394 domain-containing protein [Sphingomonas montana]|uniref:DUF4394 domain-containing protein n=1 Tax=Sphingomonas montana TaxID=1843236 RepID=UPI00096C53D4|nr:DUF4394 domain-containing protein [Sphingomonas montana]
MQTNLKRAILFGAGTLMAGTASAQSVQTLRSGTNALVSVNAATPGTIARTTAITGIAAGRTLQGFDYRPASPRLLYALDNVGQLYSINGRTGTAAAVGAPIAAAANATGAAAGLDFNPTVDRIRYVNGNRTDLRLNQTNGTLAATDGTLTYAAGDARFGTAPVLAGAAYTNNVAGATTTTLYVLDTSGGTARLATQGNASGTVGPNTGTLFSVGTTTGIATNGNVGFDIDRSGQAYATLTNPTTGVTSLYSVNLATGTATALGAISGNQTYNGLATELASFQSMGLTQNQQNVGTVLDNFATTPNDGTLGIFNGIDAQTGNAAAQSALLQSLTPAAFQSLPDISYGVLESQESTVLRYTRDLRGNAVTDDGSRVTLDEAGKVGAWISGGSRFGRIDAAQDRYRVQTDEYHFLGGADFRLTPTAALGVFGGYSNTDADLARGNAATGTLKSWYAGAYGTAAVGPLYVDAWGSYTDLDWKLSRNLSFGNYSGSTFARTSGRIITGGAATGLSFQIRNFEIEPFAQVRYADLKIDGFSETPGAAFALVLPNDMNRVSIRSNVGARVGTKFEVGGATVRPQVRGGYMYEFRNQRRNIAANFQQPGIGSQFNFVTTPLYQDYYNAGASLNISGNGPLSLVADYDVQFDNQRQFHNFTIGARLAL